jgi:hypothetical protein
VAKTNTGVSQLQQGVKLDDVSFFGEKRCYKYFIKDANTDVSVRIAMYSGVASYTFTPNKIPDKFEEALYKGAEFGNSALLITPRDRAINATSTGLYYLCFFSHMTSTYSIIVTESPIN